jgi:hypothetical protein
MEVIMKGIKLKEFCEGHHLNKEKVDKVKTTAKGLKKDFCNGCKVIGKKLRRFYHENPATVITAATAVTAGAYVTGLVQGFGVGDESAREDTARAFGIANATAITELEKAGVYDTEEDATNSN